MNDHKKYKILFLVQLPPPVHGASLMNQFLVNSKVLDDAFLKTVLNLDFVSKVSDIGKMSVHKIIKMFSFSILLFRTLWKSKFDLVYFTLSPVGIAFYRDVIFVFILKLFNSNIVYHLHGKGISEEIRHPFKKKIYEYVFRGTSVICLSKLLHYDITPIFSGQIYDVANGIPEVKIYNKDRSYKELVYLSNLKKSKGILDFVEALKILHLQQVEFKAKIIGNSSNDLSVEALKKIISKYNLNSKVDVLGPIYGENKFNELGTSGIFCFPTFYKNECFPLSILEAMMMGLVPVSTDNGAIEEIIDHKKNGMIVPRNNPAELARSLQELISKSEEEMVQLSKNAQKKYKEYYSIAIFEANILKVFNKILKRND